MHTLIRVFVLAPLSSLSVTAWGQRPAPAVEGYAVFSEMRVMLRWAAALNNRRAWRLLAADVAQLLRGGRGGKPPHWERPHLQHWP